MPLCAVLGWTFFLVQNTLNENSFQRPRAYGEHLLTRSVWHVTTRFVLVLRSPRALSLRDLSSKASSVICQRLPVGGHRSLGLACDWFCCQRMSARNVLLRLALHFFLLLPFLSLSPFWAFVQFFFVAVCRCDIVISISAGTA